MGKGALKPIWEALALLKLFAGLGELNSQPAL